MPIERYLYALCANGHTILDYTIGLEAFSDERLEYLRTRPIGTYVYWLPLEQYVVHQHVEPMEDDTGREGVWNSAVLIPIHEYLQRTDPQIVLAPYLVTPCENPLPLQVIEE